MLEFPKTKQPVILGIDPGARQIGVAIFNGNELLYYGVKTVKKSGLRKTAFVALEKIITQLMDEYETDCFALEKVVSVQQRNSVVEAVSWQIKAIAQKHHYRFKEYSPSFVRETICGKTKATRDETYRILTDQYPELRRYLSATRIWQKAYFAHLFDAVATAAVGVRELQTADDSKH